MYELKKTFTFDAAHRLYHYVGPCHNIHGHTYKVEVVVSGEELNQQNMLVDFKELKDVIQRRIEEYWDHAIILNTEDPLSTMLQENEALATPKIFVFKNEDPTCEAMSKYLYEVFNDTFDDDDLTVMFVVHETPTSCGVYYPTKVERTSTVNVNSSSEVTDANK